MTHNLIELYAFKFINYVFFMFNNFRNLIKLELSPNLEILILKDFRVTNRIFDANMNIMSIQAIR